MNDTPKELRDIAGTVETNGGWHIAAVKLRGAAEEIERLRAGLTQIRDESIVQGMSPALFADRVLRGPQT